jgi:hypothetical protein
VRAEATLPVRPPWVGLRVVSAFGATYLGDRPLPADWAAADSGGLRASVGLGLSLGWDLLRLDLYRGIRGGGWEAVFSVAPEFRDWI